MNNGCSFGLPFLPAWSTHSISAGIAVMFLLLISTLYICRERGRHKNFYVIVDEESRRENDEDRKKNEVMEAYAVGNCIDEHYVIRSPPMSHDDTGVRVMMKRRNPQRQPRAKKRTPDAFSVPSAPHSFEARTNSPYNPKLQIVLDKTGRGFELLTVVEKESCPPGHSTLQADILIDVIKQSLEQMTGKNMIVFGSTNETKWTLQGAEHLADNADEMSLQMKLKMATPFNLLVYCYQAHPAMLIDATPNAGTTMTNLEHQATVTVVNETPQLGATPRNKRSGGSKPAGQKMTGETKPPHPIRSSGQKSKAKSRPSNSRGSGWAQPYKLDASTPSRTPTGKTRETNSGVLLLSRQKAALENIMVRQKNRSDVSEMPDTDTIKKKKSQQDRPPKSKPTLTHSVVERREQKSSKPSPESTRKNKNKLLANLSPDKRQAAEKEKANHHPPSSDNNKSGQDGRHTKEAKKLPTPPHQPQPGAKPSNTAHHTKEGKTPGGATSSTQMKPIGNLKKSKSNLNLLKQKSLDDLQSTADSYSNTHAALQTVKPTKQDTKAIKTDNTK